MRVQIRFRIVTDDDDMVSEDESACFDKADARLDEIGLSLAEAKTLMASVQEYLITAQGESRESGFLHILRGSEVSKHGQAYSISEPVPLSRTAPENNTPKRTS
jgi:hypothetical protein